MALATASGTSARVSSSRVCFRPISPEERAAYVASGEPLDKAGGYGIQGRAAAFVRDLQGSYSGVVGLPLYETAELLREAERNAGTVYLFPQLPTSSVTGE